MDDDRKKFPRKGGSKPGGPRGRDGAPHKGGKPGFSSKPRAEGAKPFVKRDRDGERPFAKRRDDAIGSERPKREFRRDDRPREDGEGGFRKPRAEGAKPFVKRDRDGERPFAKRRDDAVGSDRPKREFRRDDRPREDGEGGFRKPRAEGAKPFVKRDRDGERPFAKRRDDAHGSDRPKREFRRDDRPREDGEGGFRRPRAEGERPFEKRGPRPGRAERAEARGEEFSRENRNEEFRGERPARQFDRPRSPREGGFEGRPRPTGDRPRGPRPAGAERKPFVRAHTEEEAPGERIAKRLARVGIASRRDAEELIAAGRVRVNGQVLTSPAFNVMPQDHIELDGEVIPPVERTRLFLFHKPGGLVTTNRDPEGRKTIFDVLPTDLPRLVTIGRLDINTEGLLLLTNDGGLARVLELPATGWLRRYRVRVHGKVDEKQLAGLKDGIAVDGVFYGAVEASLDREQGANAWLTIGLREGKNREVKNILGALGLDVTRLIRISYGPFQLGELPEGHVQELSGRMLRDQLGERLIEESGANFDADIIKPFSNKPVRREFEKPSEAGAPARGPRAPRPLDIGEGGLIKRNRKRDDDRHREDMRDRLQTKPDRGFKADRGDKHERSFKSDRGDRPERGAKFPRGEKPGDDRASRPFETPGVRKANVWMAPGARPIGKGRAAAEKAEVEARKSAKHHGKPFFDKAGGGKSGFGKPRREGDEGRGSRGGDRPSGPRRGKGDADRRR
ncbi:pseudouridine synthase [Pseudaminobacter soli (ex Li et al. 2025)]|uniref:Pseudouridine synthase n=1 Tax=Pseudaminobacter soli (ex Li et al. 2025) TaxID=1295366 RepID=A0A2P7S7P4_9HYPH|nr:pseudouridine synthase [Mesorhizobium soli]PSJ58496.1 RNA pseudouridine synthase [Mesorhizobium soli]